MPSLPPAITLSHTERGRGRLVVALHDLGRSSDAMLRALRPLNKRFRIIAPDLRGHGDSPTPAGPWSIDDFASDVSRLIAAEGGNAIVVGVGIGGATGLSLALGHPGLVSALVVSGAAARSEDIDGQERWARMARMIRERRGSEGVALAAEAMGTRPDLRGALVQVESPVFVLAGEGDRAYPPDAQQELARSLPGARFQRVDGAGHDLTTDRPEELVAAVEWIAGVAAQRLATAA